MQLQHCTTNFILSSTTQPSTLRGTVNEYQPHGWLIIHGAGRMADSRSSLQLGLRVNGHLALTDFRSEDPKWTLIWLCAADGWRNVRRFFCVTVVCRDRRRLWRERRSAGWHLRARERLRVQAWLRPRFASDAHWTDDRRQKTGSSDIHARSQTHAVSLLTCIDCYC